MTIPEGAGPAPAAPRSAWVLAWSSLASQLGSLARDGLRSDDAISIVVSIALGVLLVTWFSVGVMRARTVRLVVVSMVLGLTAFVELIAVLAAADPVETLVNLGLLALTGVSIGALYVFTQSSWFAWHRSNPPGATRPPLGGLLVIAVVVGVLGGVVQQVDQQARFQLELGAGGR